MKKNFFKKLASGLALAMVVTSFAPAAPALAATATKIVKQGGAKAPTTVYVGKKVDYSLNKVYGTNTYKWFTSNAAVAKVTKSGGVVTPVATGKATIKVNAYKKSTGKFVKSFTLKLDVKQRATSVDIGAEDFLLGIGETKDLNAVKTPATSTDTLRYFSSNKEVATVDVKSGVVTGVKAGEATIKVASKGAWFTSNTSKFNKYDEVKVTVGVALKAVKPVAVNKLELTFNSSVEGITANDIVVTNVESKLRLPVKSVTLSEDKKVVTAELYSKLADTKKYTVTAKDTTLDFTATVGAIHSIVVKDQVVLPIYPDKNDLSKTNAPTVLAYSVYDVNGLDITANYVLGTDIIVEATNSNIAPDGKVSLNFTGDMVKVTLKRPQWDTTTGADTSVKSAEATITAGIPSVTGIKSWVINSNPSTADFDKDAQKLTAGEEGKYLHVKATKGSSTVTTGWTFNSLDESILLVDRATGKLYPQKAGTVLVKVEQGLYVDYITIVITGERVAVSLVPDVTSTIVLSNNLSTADAKKVTFTLKDNYGDAIAYDPAKVTGPTAANASQDFISVSGLDISKASEGKLSVTFTANAGKTGSTSFRVMVGNLAGVAVVNVVKPGTATGYKAELTKTTVDPFKAGEETTGLTVYTVDAAGAKRDIVTANDLTVEVKNAKNETKVTAPYVAGLVIDAKANGLANGEYSVYVMRGTALVALTKLTVKSSQPDAVATVDKIEVTGVSTVLAAAEQAITLKVNGVEKAIDAVEFISLDSAQINAASGAGATFVLTSDVDIFIQKVKVTIDGYTYTAVVDKLIRIKK